MHEVTARYRKEEKKKRSRQCWTASVHEGGTSGWQEVDSSQVEDLLLLAVQTVRSL